MKLLNDMDEKLKMIDAFNGQLKEFHGKVVEIETWLPEGRARMDELLSPDNPTSAEDRVVQTMELQVRDHSYITYYCWGKGGQWGQRGPRGSLKKDGRTLEPR